MGCSSEALAVLGAVGTTIGIIGALAAILFGAIAARSTKRKEDRGDGHTLGTVQSDLGYIKSGVDDLKTDVRELRGNTVNLTERVKAVEESTKQAHKRIDEIKEESRKE